MVFSALTRGEIRIVMIFYRMYGIQKTFSLILNKMRNYVTKILTIAKAFFSCHLLIIPNNALSFFFGLSLKGRHGMAWLRKPYSRTPWEKYCIVPGTARDPRGSRAGSNMLKKSIPLTMAEDLLKISPLFGKITSWVTNLLN